MLASHDPNPARTRSVRSSIVWICLAAMAALLAGCGAAVAPPRTITLETLNGSGVTGTVSFSAMDAKTSVTIAVDAAGNLDMPAHIHPGSCDDLVPQPKFPLENVKNGSSSTIVPAPIEELFAGGLAVNIHKAIDDLQTYTACVDIK
jgi:hypothetical protein